MECYSVNSIRPEKSRVRKFFENILIGGAIIGAISWGTIKALDPHGYESKSINYTCLKPGESLWSLHKEEGWSEKDCRNIFKYCNPRPKLKIGDVVGVYQKDDPRDPDNEFLGDPLNGRGVHDTREEAEKAYLTLNSLNNMSGSHKRDRGALNNTLHNLESALPKEYRDKFADPTMKTRVNY